MRKPIKNERAKSVMPSVLLDQVVGGARDNVGGEVFEEDSNRYRGLLRGDTSPAG